MTFATLNSYMAKSKQRDPGRTQTVRLRQPMPNNSMPLLPTSPGASVYCFRRPTLGDKLQVLAAVAPRYLSVIEQFVDLILKRLK